MRVFVSGGSKSGKSYYAQRIAKEQSRGGSGAQGLYYIATMRPADGEDEARIEKHRDEREGWGFTTVEQPADLSNVLSVCDKDGSFLLDSLTALLANEMFLPDGSINQGAAEKIKAELTAVISAVRDIVIVSDNIFSDAMVFDPITEGFRRSLAEIDRAAVRACDTVLEVVYSTVVVHKSSEAFDALYQTIR